MLAGGPALLPLQLVRDELLDERLVVVGRARPQHGAARLRRPRRRLVLDHLQVDGVLVAEVPVAGYLGQTVLYLAQTILDSFPSFLEAAFDGVMNLADVEDVIQALQRAALLLYIQLVLQSAMITSVDI